MNNINLNNNINLDNNMNFDNNNNFYFSFSIDNNIIDIINSLNENIVNIIDLTNNNNHENNENNDNNENDDNNYNIIDHIEYNIEFEIINPSNPSIDEFNPHYKSCNEINNDLGKALKIKKDDCILNEDCFICMERYNCNEFKRILPSCKHYFHKKCIDKWLKSNASCPVCRDQLIKNN
jgi:hypothetical protein